MTLSKTPWRIGSTLKLKLKSGQAEPGRANGDKLGQMGPNWTNLNQMGPNRANWGKGGQIGPHGTK